MKSCRDDSLKLALKQIAQESRAYIITHIRAIFQGRGFLDLPKDMFIGIISSNKVSYVCACMCVCMYVHACISQCVRVCI